MLCIDSVDLSFGDKQIISGAYISVKRGEIVGLLGRNGCGKSSLLKIIFGALKSHYHHLRIGDKIISSEGFLTKEIAYLPQEHFLPDFLSVKDLSIPDERFESDQFLANIQDKKLRELSGGELKVIECLWVLSRDANYIFLDEPFKGLSPISIEMLQRLILKEKEKKGIIITDHTYQPLLEISDRVLLMHNNATYKINSMEDLIFYRYLP